MKIPTAVVTSTTNSSHKSRHKNIKQLAEKYKGVDKIEQVFNTSGMSTATTNPSPNPPVLEGLSPGDALVRYKDELTMFEKTELSQFDQIYTVGSFRRESLQEIPDSEGYYRIRVGEQLGYRYLVSGIVDKGAFG